MDDCSFEVKECAINVELSLGVSLIVAVLMVGCAQPPVQQLEAAQKAVEAARTAGAPDYTQEDFLMLEQALVQAQHELANQEKNLEIFRSYDAADRMLKRIVKDAKRVEDTAISKREDAKASALKSEKEAQTVLASAQELLAKAPVGKDRATVESLKNDLRGIQASLETVHQMIEKGDYHGAESRAKGITEKGGIVYAEIQMTLPLEPMIPANAGRTRPEKLVP
ncbi:MAG: hypothetical protein HY281_03175 [Nitrospirae bacterium]|nr:hypothetical protein [Nitrospirota bacterium]